MKKKEVVFLINCMLGGGAEKVITMLANHMALSNYKVFIVLTEQRVEDAIGYNLNADIELVSLFDFFPHLTIKEKVKRRIFSLYGRTTYSLSKKIRRWPPDSAIYTRYLSEYGVQITALRDFLLQHMNATVVAFLAHSIQLALLVKKDVPFKLVASERGNPQNHSMSKTSTFFIKKYYQLLDHMVFQSEGAKSYYPENIQKKSSIILNPISSNLPEPYNGERQKIIVNFCRISQEKNLFLLLKAFAKFHSEYPEYQLYIYGDASTDEGKCIVNELYKLAKELDVLGKFKILPFDPNLHRTIRSYSMYISSSDHEGLSNSMLEALALGIPTICTDCPPGGARTVIKNGENGLLVPVNDKQKLYLAMKRMVEEPNLMEIISCNSRNIRTCLTEEKIVAQWLKLIK